MGADRRLRRHRCQPPVAGRRPRGRQRSRDRMRAPLDSSTYTYFHQVGTCAMGPDDDPTPCSTRTCASAVDGLRVAELGDADDRARQHLPGLRDAGRALADLMA
ncbi:MAG: GMC oxidoreductase [Acidimicrobiales bacterium]